MISSFISVVVAIIVFTIIGYLFLKSKASSSTSKSRGRDPQQIDRSGLGNAASSGSSNGGLNAELVQLKWTEITAMQGNGASGLKNALYEADKLLDYVMIAKGFSGETMGDRLKSGGGAFTNLNAIWGAHKLRNQLAHEVEHDIVPNQVKNAIETFGKAISELGVRVK